MQASLARRLLKTLAVRDFAEPNGAASEFRAGTAKARWWRSRWWVWEEQA